MQQISKIKYFYPSTGQANLSVRHKLKLELGLAWIRVGGEVDVEVQMKALHLPKHQHHGPPVGSD